MLVEKSARAEVRPPCTGCAVVVPKAKDKVPLLVVLHGDREKATISIERWRAAATTRGWAVLAIQCPADQGCTNKDHSWWQWNGDPKYVMAQIDALAKSVAIDRARIVLAGWSGGATYIGMRGPDWRGVAAVILHGGGMPPISDTDLPPGCPAKLPAYFLVGDKNPLHYLAKNLRDYWQACKQPVEWELIKGGDHDREDMALDRKKAIAILDWATNVGAPPPAVRAR